MIDPIFMYSVSIIYCNMFFRHSIMFICSVLRLIMLLVSIYGRYPIYTYVHV